jgi:hypothetical protein
MLMGKMYKFLMRKHLEHRQKSWLFDLPLSSTFADCFSNATLPFLDAEVLVDISHPFTLSSIRRLLINVVMEKLLYTMRNLPLHPKIA